jgi:putative oxidoreductase
MISLGSPGFRKLAVLLTRLGLGSAFLSSVADRFGAWGAKGTTGVSWGDFQHFIAYTETMIPYAPTSAVPVIAWVATVFEAAFGLGLLLGLRTKTMAAGAGCLLLAFAVATVFSPAGPHGVLASSVLSAAGASLLLACVANGS